MIADQQGRFNYSTAVETFALTDWWDGKKWHLDDPWSTNTINRFRPDVATLYSAIAIPCDHKVSICTGNPGMPYWGTLASGQTGTYVNLTIGKRPEDLVFDLKEDASAAMWKTVQVMGKQPPEKAANLWAEAENNYWEAVWWLDRAVLEKEFRKGGCLGKSGNQLCGSDRAGGKDPGSFAGLIRQINLQRIAITIVILFVRIVGRKGGRARGGKR